MGRWITEQPLAVAPLLRELENFASGALVVFYGVVRNENEGQPVAGMTYEAHVPLAEQALAAIEREAVERFGAALPPPVSWGNQAYYAADRIPYVGPVLPGMPRSIIMDTVAAAMASLRNGAILAETDVSAVSVRVMRDTICWSVAEDQ